MAADPLTKTPGATAADIRKIADLVRFCDVMLRAGAHIVDLDTQYVEPEDRRFSPEALMDLMEAAGRLLGEAYELANGLVPLAGPHPQPWGGFR